MTLAGRPESEGHADAGAAYREQIADFLVAHSFRQDHGGYLAFEGELIAGGTAMQVDRQVVVDVEGVLCEWPEAARIKPVPSLWFSIDNEGVPFASFAVETELVIEALENAAPPMPGFQMPIPAVEARDPHLDRVVGGDSLQLGITPIRVEAASEAAEPRLPAGGIHFEIWKPAEDEQEKAAAYSFAMAGLVPMLALSAALARYSGPSAFDLEADELRQEIERATEP
jgi:hypothetical protein